MTKHKYLLIVIVLLSIFTRFYQPITRFAYDHDSDLSAWIFKDIVIDHHLRLIGQQTSSAGVFIGPYFYYLLIPFYLLAHLDPIGTVLVPPLLGVVGVLSFYQILQKVFDKKTAFYGATIYAASFLIASSERQVVPTMFIFIWSIWFFYAAFLLAHGKKSGLLISSILLALAWHIQLILVIVSLPLFILFLTRIRDFKPQHLILPLLTFIILSVPLLLFEFRHGGIQIKSLFFTFGSQAEQVVRTKLEKTVHVLGIAAKNSNAIFWHRPESISLFALPLIMFAYITILVLKKRFSLTLYFVLSSWFVLFIGFFILHPINLSEYYLGSLNVVWIILAAVLLVNLGRTGEILLLLFITLNLYLLVTQTTNHAGYLNRKQIVDHIAKDAESHNYPCIAISYMTNPGYELGYRYLFWLKKLHVNRPDSNSPVYTIVFPHPRANHLDYTSGALGLVSPDYSRYNPVDITHSCSGQNSNLTDPMFGFTK